MEFSDEYQGPSGPFCSAPTHAAVCSYLQHRFQPQQLVLQQTAVLSHVFEGELIQHLHVAAPPTIGGSEAGRQPLGLEAVVVLDGVVAPEVGRQKQKGRWGSLGLPLGTSRLGALISAAGPGRSGAWRRLTCCHSGSDPGHSSAGACAAAPVVTPSPNVQCETSCQRLRKVENWGTVSRGECTAGIIGRARKGRRCAGYGRAIEGKSVWDFVCAAAKNAEAHGRRLSAKDGARFCKEQCCCGSAALAPWRRRTAELSHRHGDGYPLMF